MSMSKFAVAVSCVALALAVPAGAMTVDIQDPWSPGDSEVNFYDIWNVLYPNSAPGGLNYTSSMDVWNDWGNDSLAAQQGMFALTVDPGEVEVEAVYAGNQQDFGWYYPTNQPLGGGDSQTLITDASAGDSATFSPSGTPFGFYLTTTGAASNTFYVNRFLNPNDNPQGLVFSTPVANELVIAWEDINLDGGSDRDYNDLVVRLRDVKVVPEPATMTLLGMGLAGAAFRRFRSNRLR